MNNSLFSIGKGSEKLLNLLFLLFLLISVVAILFDAYILLLMPSVALLSLFIIKDLKLAYFLMIMSIPLSIEYYFGSLSLDAPDELFNIALLFILPGFILYNYKELDFSFVRHPIVVLLFVLFIISVISTIFSVNQVLSIKYLLAKAWYIVGYFGFTAFFLKDWKDVKKLSILVGFTCTLTLIYVMVRHSASGFSFSEINFCVGPFYSNHVNYAVQLLVVFPFLWFLSRIHKLKWGQSYFYIALILLYAVAIYFSYTRAAIGTMILAIPFYYIIKFKLVKPAIVLTLIGVISYGAYVIKDNRFFEFAPDYNKTISHQDFNKLLSATYNLEDISTMERVYRWVAARYMIEDKPLLGVGPNNFYDNYKAFTLRSFQTYVSDNPDRSTVHSYVLLLAIEQGIFSAIMFIFLVCYALIIGQRIYHDEKDEHNKLAIMAALICLFSIMVVLSINDVVESDKEGSFFYISLGIIAGFHWRHHKREKDAKKL